MIEIVKTGDGSTTLYVPEIGDHYHSVHGAIQESEFIFIGCGLDYSKTNPVRIFETGFGTGLNALLSCMHASANQINIIYTSIEKYPLGEDIVRSLNYTDLLQNESGILFEKIHSCKWNIPVKISAYFTLHKIEADFTNTVVPGSYDLIYFDAFGPGKQPGMWSDDIFRKISILTSRNGIFVTYSVSGEVKRLLRKYGFEVSLLPGPPGKRQILRAIKF